MPKPTKKQIEAMQKLGIFFPEMEEDMKASAEWLMQGLHEIYPKIFDVDILTDAEIAGKASLKLTSLYDLAVAAGIEDAPGFVQHFIDYEREVARYEG